MTQKAVNNAKVLYRLNISRSDVEEAHKIFTKAPFLLETLTNPVVSEEAKEVVLDKIARQSGMTELLENFMKMMCRIGEINPSKARFVNARPMPKRMTSLSSSTTLTAPSLPRRIIALNSNR